MAATATLIKRNSCPGGEVHLYLSLSGTYTSGGDTIDLRPFSGTSKSPYLVVGASDNGMTVAYVAGKLKLYIGGAEVAGGAAVPAGSRVLAIFPKFG